MHLRQNIKDGAEESLQFVDILIMLQTHLITSKIEIPEYKNRISTLATKTILNCNSILELLKGQDIDSKYIELKAKFLDISGLYILLRAQLENFLIFDFIYCQPKTEDEIQFRYYNWIYSGLISRNEYYHKGEFLKEKKLKDQEEIRLFRKKITESDYFKKFTANQQKQIIEKGEPRLFNGWNKLMDFSKIHADHSKSLYNLLSAHAHTTGLSIMNLDGMDLRHSSNNSHGHLIMLLSKLLLTKFIVLFKSTFKATEIKYNTLPSSTLNKLEFYSNLLSAGITIGA